ncbi:arginase family protein [Candidatus Nanohalobium constans]|uniref:Agmatinase n=1 Tax=Candidatus Nanohalobium constans TaxID=2565781 RepID=A0A5Q0UJ60_9ARCH|nr:arginase family protein [Candidatus Nanohalobium constans]QGA80869.1 agmatinase [Candidatus Nanohalobium constans]
MKTNSPEDAEILLQKLPSDIGIHRNPRKGTLNAPEVILEGFEPGKDVLIDEVFIDEFDLEKTHERIRENTEELLEYDKPIFSLGGDHSVSFPVIKALKQENPGMQLVWLDSHLDLKEKVDGHVSHDVVVRELLNSGFEEDEITFVGITRVDDDEQEFLDQHDLDVYRADEVLSEFLQEYDSTSPTYLSVDIDVLSEDEAPGTGYPDGRLSMQQVERVIEKVKPVHADLVEVAPPFDEEGKTVGNAKEILGRLTEVVR